MSNMKIIATNQKILSLKDNEVFVFGSNMSGVHGAGAAKLALERFGAIWGVPRGIQGQSYAIPTKDFDVVTSLPLGEIYRHIQEFGLVSQQNPHIEFLVTEIGCGLARYTPEQIAPMFFWVKNGDTNVWLPQRFWDVLGA
jgi:hypothetical protein